MYVHAQKFTALGTHLHTTGKGLCQGMHKRAENYRRSSLMFRPMSLDKNVFLMVRR